MRCLYSGVLLGSLLGPGLARAQQPAPPRPAPAVTLEAPRVSLGAPVPLPASRTIVRGQNPDEMVKPSPWVASLTEPAGTGVVQVIAPLTLPTHGGGAPSAPTPATLTSNSSSTYAPPPAAGNLAPPPPLPPSPNDPLMGLTASGASKSKKPASDSKSMFGDMFGGGSSTGGGKKWFESDSCFENVSTPISNPFYFEDPRAVTEIRPLFFYQLMPGSAAPFQGGNLEYLGLQARVAFNEHWSLVINKLGWTWFNPTDDTTARDANGLSEIWLGPKWTFLRNSETGTILATGATFQLPVGPAKVFQNTGTLSIVPYITGAQNFGHTNFGSFNVIGTAGYSLSINSARSDFLFTSMHLDFDIANQHKWFPMVELNWFAYTKSGDTRPFNVEGRDWANMGSTDIAGTNSFTIATGLRYKFSEKLQTGVMVEFPLSSSRDLLDFRLGVDFIFRY